VLRIGRTGSPVERERSGVLLRGETVTRVDEVGGALDGFSSQSGKGEEERMGGSGPVPHGRREMGERERGGGGPRRLSRQHEAKKCDQQRPPSSGTGDAVVAEQGRAAGRG
jgi:hypothetical protein